ncbi:MAG: hypothetical protein IJT12_08750 [Paludibacteraceae bacterium]|nr:hypothetical protein [Paludibacteraceae bacterium]
MPEYYSGARDEERAAEYRRELNIAALFSAGHRCADAERTGQRTAVYQMAQ